MKTKIIKKTLLLLFMSIVVACSSDSEGGGNGGGEDVLTSIEITSNLSEIDQGQSVIFTVTTNLGDTVTSSATIYVNDNSISGISHVFNQGGQYNIYATYEGFTSNTIVVNVEGSSDYSDTSAFSASGAPISFTKKVLLEDFTGTWCPNCPPAAAAIANAKTNNSNIFGVGYHDGDPMQIEETSYWQQYYNVTGFPTVYVNGADTRWNFPDMTQVNAELSENADLGLAVSADILGGKLDVEVKVAYSSNISEEIRLRIYLVEDNVTSSSAQAGSSQGTAYVHRDVLREVYTDKLGDVIASENVASGGIFTRTLTGHDLPSSIDDINELKVIVLVHNTYTKTFTDYFGVVHTDSPHYDIYNVQEVHVGSFQDFD